MMPGNGKGDSLVRPQSTLNQYDANMWSNILLSVLFLSLTNGYVIKLNLTLEELNRIGFEPYKEDKSKEIDNTIDIEKPNLPGVPAEEPPFIKVNVKPLCGSQCDDSIESTTNKNLITESDDNGSTQEITTETNWESTTETLEKTQETTIKLTPHEHLLLMTETEFYSPSESSKIDEFSSREIPSENL